MIEYVELAAAREASGVRMVVASVVPSPWSEAAKGVFRIGGVPVKAVRQIPRDKAAIEWTGVDNAPAVVHGDEPVRSCWSQIVGLAARLAPQVLPAEPSARARAMGLLELIAGEEGLGWNARLAMIHAGLTSDGARGFPAQVSKYLARRYGYAPERAADLHARTAAQFSVLRDALGDRTFFGGDAPDAVDVYTATFLTPLTPISEADCPRFAPPLRHAFASAAEALGPLVPEPLFALRTRMFQRHLAWPIEI